MAAPDMRYPRRRANGGGDLVLPAARVGRRGLQRQLLDSGRAFMLLAVAVFTWHQLAGGGCDPELVLAAFLLWLLGASLAMLSLVSRQFPRPAGAAAALATALRRYLLGGL